MSRDVALRSGEDDETNADDESDDSDYDSGRDHMTADATSCASASGDGHDSSSGSDDEGASPSIGDSGSHLARDQVAVPHSSNSSQHGHHHGRGAHTASGNGHALNHSSDHDSDSGSECGANGKHKDADYDSWFGGAHGERSCYPSDDAPQAEYALEADFASAGVPPEACQGRDTKVRSLQASLYKVTKKCAVSEEHAS